MLVIGLTGGIGSGKTTVSDLFKLKNIPIIDTDIIARELVEKDQPAYKEIVNVFGEKVLTKNKNINRQALGKIIFSSKKKRLQLEAILHPLIWNKVKQQLSALAVSTNKPAYSIVVVPLLLENLNLPYSIKFDRILVVDTEESMQVKRTLKRDDKDESSIRKIIKSQVSRRTRLAAADDIISNEDDLLLLSEKVDSLHNFYLKLQN